MMMIRARRRPSKNYRIRRWEGFVWQSTGLRSLKTMTRSPMPIDPSPKIADPTNAASTATGPATTLGTVARSGGSVGHVQGLVRPADATGTIAGLSHQAIVRSGADLPAVVVVTVVIAASTVDPDLREIGEEEEAAEIVEVHRRGAADRAEATRGTLAVSCCCCGGLLMFVGCLGPARGRADEKKREDRRQQDPEQQQH